jgi:hypothetical protein
LRLEFEKQSKQQTPRYYYQLSRGLGYRKTSAETVEIHGAGWNADYVRDATRLARSSNWHWQKSSWKPRDIAISRKNGSISFALSLAQDSAAFELVKQGWKKTTASCAAGNFSNPKKMPVTAPATPTATTGYAWNASKNSGSARTSSRLPTPTSPDRHTQNSPENHRGRFSKVPHAAWQN